MFAVINRTAEFCQRHSELRVPMTSHTGSQYVASLMTSDAPTCARSPWSVEASPGQHINITLWDFTTVDDRRLSASSSLYGSAAARPPPPTVTKPSNINPAASDTDAAAALFVETGVTCRKYAVVQDGARQLTLCGGSRRLAGSYVSRDSGVKLWIIAGVASTDRQRFLLKFAGLSNIVLSTSYRLQICYRAINALWRVNHLKGRRVNWLHFAIQV